MDDVGDKPRHSLGTLMLLAFDMFFTVCAFLELAYVVPVFEEMFSDFETRLPTATRVLWNISNALGAFYGFGFYLLTCLSLWMMFRMYWALHRRGEKMKLEARLRIILFSCFVLIVIITATLFLPIFKMCGLATAGPITESNK